MYWEVSNILQWKEEGSGKLYPVVNRVIVCLYIEYLWVSSIPLIAQSINVSEAARMWTL